MKKFCKDEFAVNPKSDLKRVIVIYKKNKLDRITSFKNIKIENFYVPIYDKIYNNDELKEDFKE